ncbi:unnamed protein product [Protopolystoma xenopodis]|uniref:Uncharacterized protein n=1 Tax=Protopolystoma xenopodis TaxID=117903 RepID=A0A3S5AFP5_9PLAT|nr:unnamed protein product [Protopolystoma xenopodis]
MHCRGSNPAEGVDKTNARSKLQVPTVLHFRGSNPAEDPAEGVDKTNARSKLQSTQCRGSNPAEGVDKTNARSKMQSTQDENNFWKSIRGSVAEWLACQATVLHCRGSNPADSRVLVAV